MIAAYFLSGFLAGAALVAWAWWLVSMRPEPRMADREPRMADRDPDTRCAVCGWPLMVSRAAGCVRGDCSMRPRPTVLYDPARAEREAASCS